MKETCLAMCMEYCAGGDLYNFLPADGMDEVWPDFQSRGRWICLVQVSVKVVVQNTEYERKALR